MYNANLKFCGSFTDKKARTGTTIFFGIRIVLNDGMAMRKVHISVYSPTGDCFGGIRVVPKR
jgi:hypothetical protein